MTDEQFAQLLQRLDQLAGKLGDGGQGIWAATLAQAPIDGWASVFWYLTLAACGYGLYRMWKHILSKDWGYNSPEVPAGILSVIYAIVVFVTIAALPVMIAAFVNPNYWALRHLLGMLTKK